MNDVVLYLALGIILGAAGALVGIGVVLWLRSPASEAGPASSSADDQVIRLVPLVAGEWLLETGGKRYRRLSEVHGTAAAPRVQAMLAWLGQFAGQPVSAPSPSASPPRPAAPPPTAQPPLPAPAEDEFLRSLRTPAPAPAPPKMLFGRKQAAGGPAKADESPAAFGIAGQIEKALQKRLERTPDMLTRHIHVSAAPDGSLRVEVDGRFYPGINDVPDSAVRAVLQSAVQDWEASV